VRSLPRCLAQLLAFALVTGLLAVSTPVVRAQRAGDRVPGSFIVELRRGVSTAEASRIAKAYGGRVSELYDGLGGFAFEGPDSARSKLAADKRVNAVEDDALVEATGGLTHLNRMDVPDARTAGYDGTGISIAIIDTGVTKGHNTFDPGQVVKGKSCVGGRSTKDGEGHGTGSASNAAGKIGVARNATIVPVKVFKGRSLFTPISKVICGLNWVKKRNNAAPGTIDVVNLSLAYSGGSRALQKATANARLSGAVIVAAAGNNGGNTQAPAKYAGVIAVSALARGSRMAYFSAKGGLMTAPGVNIRSAENGRGYSRRSGTSRSSPMVAGAAAIVLGEDGTLTPAQVLDVLQQSGRCPNGATNGSPGFCGGRWKGDDKKAEPLVDAYCAGVLASPGDTDLLTCGF
jgi:subtilisin